MKASLLALLITLGALVSHAEIIKSSKVQIAPSTISAVISLIPGVNDKKIQVVVADHGLSTDVSPRYTIYLGFAAFAERGNITADFKITEQPVEFLSATRKSAGHYTVKTREYTDGGMVEATYEIDATKVFADEHKERNRCASDFCDLDLETSISIKRTEKGSR
ncbi:MAG TPA: hypothetical protein VIG33_12865 [Pseudobdellovibrionaceae bacterium]|jgi:hypothetical protein